MRSWHRLLFRAALVPARLPIEVTTTLVNSGPGPMVRTAELLVDGQVVPGTAQTVGPIPAGGRAPLTFRTALTEAGGHLLTARLAGTWDALPGDDESSLPVEVAQALPVLLVNGEPGVEPLTGETDFLRAALAPIGDETPQVSARVVTASALSADSLKGQRAVVLANVDQLSSAQELALRTFVEAGGGLLVAPGDRTNPAAFGGIAWMPARFGALKGSARDRKTIAHPDPRTFTGALLGPFARGERPALGEADFFAYRLLAPIAGASVSRGWIPATHGSSNDPAGAAAWSCWQRRSTPKPALCRLTPISCHWPMNGRCGWPEAVLRPSYSLANRSSSIFPRRWLRRSQRCRSKRRAAMRSARSSRAMEAGVKPDSTKRVNRASIGLRFPVRPAAIYMRRSRATIASRISRRSTRRKLPISRKVGGWCLRVNPGVS